MSIRLPTPRDEEYWSRDALVAEEKRVFEICNGCRLCWNLCPSFPALFKAVDDLDVSEPPPATDDPPRHAAPDALGNHAHATGDHHAAATREDVLGQAEALERLPLSAHQRVADLCYQCKLCDPICPYTPPHEFAVDFPRLMLRHKAIDTREHGLKLQDRVLGDPDMVGRLGTIAPSLANFATNLKLNRVLMEHTVGIHRDRKLPKFAAETFREWFRKRHPTQPPPAEVQGEKVVLFYTCSVQWNEPQVGRAAVEVLEHNGIVVYAPETRCCGMPALDSGEVQRASGWAEQNIAVLKPYVDAGCAVVSPGPTCSYMIKKEWPEYLGTADAQAVAARAYDLMEYINELRRKDRLYWDEDEFPVPIGEVAYHLPCHLKVQKIGFRSRDVMKRIPGTTVKLVDRCSCMDGTWGMKKEYYALSAEGARPLIEDMAEAQNLVSDCLIAKLQIEEGTGRSVTHPIEVLWKAYGGAPASPLQRRGAPPQKPPDDE